MPITSLPPPAQFSFPDIQPERASQEQAEIKTICERERLKGYSSFKPNSNQEFQQKYHARGHTP